VSGKLVAFDGTGFAETFLTQQTLKNQQHQPNVVIPSAKTTICQFCNVDTGSLHRLCGHVNEHHLEEAQHIWTKCLYCPRFFPNAQNVFQHTYRHHRQKEHLQVTVDEDNFQFLQGEASSDKTSDHLYAAPSQERNDVIEDYVLPTEEDVDANNPSTDDHAYAIQPSKSRGAIGRKPKQNLIGIISCQFCDLDFRSPRGYYDHVNLHHWEEASQLWHECVVCSRIYPKVQSLSQHYYVKHSMKKQSLKQMMESGALEPQNYERPTNNGTRGMERSHEVDENEVDENEPTFRHSAMDNDNDTSSVAIDQNGDHELVVPDENDQQQDFDQNDGSEFESTSFGEAGVQTERDSMFEDSVFVVGGDETSQQMNWTQNQTPTCQLCRVDFLSSTEFYHHSNLFHKDVIEKIWQLCKECTWYFPAKRSLNNHGCKFPAGWNCQFCQMSFESKSLAYVSHANKDHIKVLKKAGWVACKYCFVFYPNERDLFQHYAVCSEKQEALEQDESKSK
jgi:hypothetical protein